VALWWYSAAGEPAGPIDDQQLQVMAAQGQLSPQSPIYREDLGSWHTLETFEAILGLHRNSWGAYFVPTTTDPLQGGPLNALASPWQRVAAYWLDGLTVRAICWVLFFVFAPSLMSGSTAALVAFVVLVLAAPVVYETMLHAIRGQTMGKWKMGIEVVGCEHAELLTIGRAFARSVVGIFTWPINVCMVLCWSERRGLHDLAVNSRVQKVV